MNRRNRFQISRFSRCEGYASFYYCWKSKWQ